MDGGIVGHARPSAASAPASHPDIGEIKMHVLGSDGALVISEARPEVAHLLPRPAGKAEFRQRRVAGDNDFLLMDDFARAIDTGGDTILDARAGRAIFATVEAAVDSGRLGRPVDVG